jgi:outer membrane protein assembly factor BamD (BamD/ComL family)
MKMFLLPIFLLILFSSCAMRSVEKTGSSLKSGEISGFLYMEEVYAYAKNSFSAGKFDEAVLWYERLDSDYPMNPYRSESLFIRGYIYKNFKDDPDAAAVYFNEIIEKHSGSEFYNSAKFELEHLNDPDFMPEFEKQGKK